MTAAPNAWGGAIAAGGAAAVASFAVVGLVRRYALRRGVLDHPNERSSHVAPTPRGGGLGIVAVLLLATPAWGAALGIGLPVAALLAAAVGAVALVGWLDDRATLGVRPRIGVHLAAAGAVAAAALAAGVGGPIAALPAAAVAVWWVLWTVSAINVVNFMDGIDGLIASQMVLFGAYVAWVAPAGSGVPLAAAVFAGASAGFLAWNWSPARIFLGDVGSGALGIAAVLLGVALLRAADGPVARAYLPLAPLFADATVTLVRRAVRGERVWSAHREHLYQRLANGPWTHARTAVAYLGLAAVGAAVGVVASPAAFPALVAAYGAVVVVAGAALEAVARGHARGPLATG